MLALALSSALALALAYNHGDSSTNRAENGAQQATAPNLRCAWSSAAPGRALRLVERCAWSSAAPGRALRLVEREL